MILPKAPVSYDVQDEQRARHAIEQEDKFNRKTTADVDIGKQKLFLTSPDGTRRPVTADNYGNVSEAGKTNGFRQIFYSTSLVPGTTNTGIPVNTGGGMGVLCLAHCSAQNSTGNFTAAAIYMLRFGYSGDIVNVTTMADDRGSTGISAWGFVATGSHTLGIVYPSGSPLNAIVSITQLI